MPRSEEQKARIAADVVTREEVQQAKAPPLGGNVTVYPDDMAYFTTGATHGVRSLEEALVTHVQVVPRPDLGKIFVVPCGSKDPAAEDFLPASNGTATCSFVTGLFKFTLPRRKNMNKVFNSWVEQETEYGPALVVDIAGIKWKKITPREDKEEQKKGGAMGEQSPE